ncbi:MAG: DUF1847 domain-containing protein [Candidatus Rokubacteria bacterium]|nr:DUF1847 domain-containing protein [Candidatus Rokubacteria bacterium]
MTYRTVSCAYCPPTVRACRQGESDARGPGFCPSKVDPAGIAGASSRYADAFVRDVARASALVESEGYCRWTRVEEIVHLAQRLGFRKIGIATCISFVDLAHTLSAILESHGFEVASAACKNGGVSKEAIGVRDDQKIRPGTYEPMCNPVSQAELLNRAGCQLNVVLGLCVGHDSLFFKHSDGLATTLVAKDRVLAHNPIGALHLADTYYARVWGPQRPAKPPAKPAEGRSNDSPL